MQQRRYPISLVALILGIAVINVLAEMYYWYWTMRWFDRPMHFLGGVWLAASALWWVYERKGVIPPRFSRVLLVCVAAAFGIGALWELMQAGLGLETAGHVSRLGGTISDLLFDILGGVAAAVWGWARVKK